MSHYDEVLDEARKKGEILANKYIFELYSILRDEERLPPEDCRAKIEQDCMDLWSKATIRKFLPEEAKNPKKSKAGKTGAEQKKKRLEVLQIIEQTTDGIKVEADSSGARFNPAENNSFSQEKEESRTFHDELSRQLADRSPSRELLEATRIISEKDSRIKELEDLAAQGNFGHLNSELYLPEKLAHEIYDAVRIQRSKGIQQIDFILRHDGRHITAVVSLNATESDSACHEVEPHLDSRSHQ
jgi:hypothetical protein